MYSESDIETAVAAGVLTPEAAAAFRTHVASGRASPLVDDESFRLLTGFNDIFVAIAIALLLAALAWIGGDIWTGLGGLFVAGASWALAEYFTAKRRMALPSILLLLGFVGGVAATQIGSLVEILGENVSLNETEASLIGAGVALVTAASAWFHWRRFHVPITVAAGVVACVGVFLATLAATIPDLEQNILWGILAGGLGTFATAMWWDRQDRERTTRKSDVAFWLHLAAAPMIAHPVFNLLGVMDGDINIGQGLIVIALYLAFAVISLAIDRRALLVSSLAYVLFAMSALFDRFGAVSMSVALTALVIGSGLLMLSAFWANARRAIVLTLPDKWKSQLAVIDRPAVIPQPAS
jgi:MFS family permease